MKSLATIKESRGAVAPLVAIMLILIVVCVALVVDLGHVHNVKVQLQRAVDAAALAGAQELTGGTGAAVNARNVAVATALANTVDQEQVVIDPDSVVNPSFKGQAIVAVQPIRWDPNIIHPTTGNTQTTNDRIDPLDVASYNTANGLWVTAQRDVNHVFFFFTGSTQVTADAIAVATPEVPVLPLAIVTCIPAEEMLENPGSLPDMTVCGISAYSFDPDPDDTAAWTSLTLGANAADIVSYMDSETGRQLFNSIIFGQGLGSDGLENTRVAPIPSTFSSTFQGCPDYLTPFPNGTNIPCGLGRVVEGIDLATQDDFNSNLPPNLADIDPAFGGRAPGFDPLKDYGDRVDGALPRWYHLNAANSDFDNADHFTRVWSQDGILIRKKDSDDNPEPLSSYLDRLTTLATCPVGDTSCRPYGDDRFLEGNFIIDPSPSLANDLEDVIGVEPAYWPNFLEVVKHAGYPKVGVINGNAASILAAFINNATDGTNLRCSDNDPFPAGEKTLRVNAPVIFAGACENWTAIANASPNQELRYIGMSKLLVTRLWRNMPNRFDCGDDTQTVRLHGGEGCGASDFNPGLAGGTYFSLPAQSPPAPASLMAIEGLTLVPATDDEEDHGSLLKVFLVE